MKMGERNFWVIIPAAGIGSRMQNVIPKQYLSFEGKTVIEHALLPFLSHATIKKIVVSLHPEDQHWSTLSVKNHDRLMTTTGGSSRAHSVLAAIKTLENEANEQDWLIIHDAVRPFITLESLNFLMDEIEDHAVGGLYGIPVSDTLKIVCDQTIQKTHPRDQLWRAQTPQIFRFGLLQKALQNISSNELTAITDDASVLEQLGYSPKIVVGDPCNIKITTQQDWQMAQRLARK